MNDGYGHDNGTATAPFGTVTGAFAPDKFTVSDKDIAELVGEAQGVLDDTQVQIADLEADNEELRALNYDLLESQVRLLENLLTAEAALRHYREVALEQSYEALDDMEAHETHCD